MTTHKKLLNICLVSSDEREFENIMNEQYTAAQAAHLSWEISKDIIFKCKNSVTRAGKN